MTRKLAALLATLCMIILSGFAAASYSKPAVTVTTGKVPATRTAGAPSVIRLGLATGQTGYLAPYDGPALKGFRLAVSALNAAGGIGGKTKIQYQVKDTGSDPARTAVAAQELLDSHVDLLVLPSDADPAIAGGQLAQKAKIPAMSFAATSPALTTSVGDYMFGNYPPDNQNAYSVATYARKKGLKSAYLLGSPDQLYTEVLPKYFEQTFTRLGGKIVGRGTFKSNQQDFSAEVTKIRNLKPAPDVIYTSSFEPVFPAFIKQLRGAGVKIPVLGADALDSPTTLSLGKLVNGTAFGTLAFPLPGSALAKFYAKVAAKYGKDNATVYAAAGANLVQVVAAAVNYSKC